MTKKTSKEIWVIDAETDPFKKGRIPEPFIWDVYDGADHHIFTDTETMVEFVQENDVIIYAHNGGKFDWHFITEYIADFEPLTIINGRLAKFNLGFAELRDSFNIIPAPLAAYKKDEIDYAIFEADKRNLPENWSKIETYLKSDCEYLHEMVSAFIEEYGLNLTQASAAMKFWSKLAKIKKPQTTATYYKEIARYYYGGRVECFRLGTFEEEFSVVDIRSAYPYAMTFKHPWGTNYAIYDTLSDELKSDDDKLSRCLITIKARAKGCFPLRQKTGLSFPNDNQVYEFNITGWEFMAARDTTGLGDYEVLEVIEYLDDIDFTQYVDHFFAIKNDADKEMKRVGEKHKDYSRYVAQRLFAKIFLNALYGKFASNPENYEEFMTIPASMIAGAIDDGWGYCKMLSDETAVVNRPLNEEKRRYYDVAVSASITGFVRAYLWRSLYACGKGILYCDTDSIAALDISNVLVGDKLGEWELEAQCDYGAIAGKKLYAFRKRDGKWKIASKGVRLTPQTIVEIAQGDVHTYEPDVPTFSMKQDIKFTPRRIKRLDRDTGKLVRGF